jgi:predicted DNA-binding transcriptional regulator AlpA
MDKIEKMYTADEVAKILKIGRSTLYAGIKRGQFPPPVKVAGSSRWKESQLIEYINNLQPAA